MNCAVHREAEAAGYCRNCGRALCAQCVRNVRGMLYCEDCLARAVALPPASAAAGTGSPALALFLGFIPGLGAVYNGEYTKAIVQVAVFAGLVTAANASSFEGYQTFVGLAIACFYLYMPIDSYRVAKARQAAAQAVPAAAAAQPQTQVGAPAPAPPLAQASRPNWWLGPVVLVVLGILFLLGNFGLLEADWPKVVGPILLILLGGWLLWRRLSGSRTKVTQ